MTASNARLAAELQAVALGIYLVGLDRLPEVMRPVSDDADARPAGISSLEEMESKGSNPPKGAGRG